MSEDEFDELARAARVRRKVTEARRAYEASEKSEQTTDTFRIQWNHAAPGYLGAWGSHFDMIQAQAKLDVLADTIEDIPAFLEWVVNEWRTLKFRSGTAWMATDKKDMLPRHPTMRFVLHHWTHFYASFIDREQEIAFDYVDPEVDEKNEVIAYLEGKLREAAKFGQEAQLLRARQHIKALEADNAKLRAQLAPLVDLDSELPTWEEKQNAEV